MSNRSRWSYHKVMTANVSPTRCRRTSKRTTWDVDPEAVADVDPIAALVAGRDHDQLAGADQGAMQPLLLIGAVVRAEMVPEAHVDYAGSRAGLAEGPADRGVGIDEVGLDQQEAGCGRHPLEALERRGAGDARDVGAVAVVIEAGSRRARPAPLELRGRVLAAAIGLIEQGLDPERAVRVAERRVREVEAGIHDPDQHAGAILRDEPSGARAQADLRQHRGQPRLASFLALYPAHGRILDQSLRGPGTDLCGDEAPAQVLDRLGLVREQVGDVFRIFGFDQDRGAGLLGRPTAVRLALPPAARAAGGGRNRRSARPTIEIREIEAFGENLNVTFP
jgi:hypothetical protein